MPKAKPERAAEAEARYLRELAALLADLLDDGFVGAYAGGSYALGDYHRETSDLDVAAVARGRLGDRAKDEIAAAVRHESLRCPARGLELVVYRSDTARSRGAEPDFELNLNSGRGLESRIDRDPGSVAGHWFPIDRSILAQAGIALAGPPAGEVFAGPAREALLPVLLDSVRWHSRETPESRDGLANACRALRYAAEERWCSKPEALRWAEKRGMSDIQTVTRRLKSSMTSGGKPGTSSRSSTEE